MSCPISQSLMSSKTFHKTIQISESYFEAKKVKVELFQKLIWSCLKIYFTLLYQFLKGLSFSCWVDGWYWGWSSRDWIQRWVNESREKILPFCAALNIYFWCHSKSKPRSQIGTLYGWKLLFFCTASYVTIVMIVFQYQFSSILALGLGLVNFTEPLIDLNYPKYILKKAFNR